MIDPLRQPLIDLFLDYNTRINLSAIRDQEGVYYKHIMDALEVVKIVDFSWIRTIADIGTWWWFPLLPLAMSFPAIAFTGIDSTRKKLQAIQDISLQLSLHNVACHWARIEEVDQTFDCVTARAVAHISQLLPWTQRLLTTWSRLILYKQDIWWWDQQESEYNTMIQLLPQYSLILTTTHCYTLFPWDISRVIYVLRKL